MRNRVRDATQLAPSIAIANLLKGGDPWSQVANPLEGRRRATHRPPVPPPGSSPIRRRTLMDGGDLPARGPREALQRRALSRACGPAHQCILAARSMRNALISSRSIHKSLNISLSVRSTFRRGPEPWLTERAPDPAAEDAAAIKRLAQAAPEPVCVCF